MMSKKSLGIIGMLAVVILIGGIVAASYMKSGADDHPKTTKYCITVSNESLSSGIELAGSKFLYLDMGTLEDALYLYDFSTCEKTKILSLTNFALAGRGKVRIGNYLYFYMSFISFQV